jgi:hypothetical protein
MKAYYLILAIFFYQIEKGTLLYIRHIFHHVREPAGRPTN